MINQSKSSPRSNFLFEMATGALPFDAADPVEVTRMHVRESPPSPRNFVPQIHPEFEAIILRCLEKKPIKRWQTARELGRQLTRLSFIVEELGDLTELSDTPSAPVAASQNPQRSTMPTMPAVADFDSVPPPDSWRPEDSRSSLPVVSPSSLPPVGPRVVTPIGGGIPEVESAPHDTNDAPASPSLPVASPSLPPQQEVAPEAETPVQSEAISAVTETSDSAPVSRFGLVLVAALGALLVIAMWWMLS